VNTNIGHNSSLQLRRIVSVFAFGAAALVLFAACGCGNSNVGKKEEVSGGADNKVSEKGNSEVKEIHADRKKDAVNSTLAAREELAKLNIKFPEEFMRCVQNNDTLAVRFFLEAGINTEERDSIDHWTPLMHAAYKGNLDMVRLLLDHGADVFAKQEMSFSSGIQVWTASRCAREQDHSKVAKTIEAVESRFTQSLGTVPGTYLELPDANWSALANVTNKWEFTADGRFQRFQPPDEVADTEGHTEGPYRVKE